MALAIANQAQILATKRLRDTYKYEYQELYRQAVIELGGTPRRSKEERIADLLRQIEELKK